MRKILVIYATAGAGHRKAAEALAEEFRTRPDSEVTLADSLDYTNLFYKNVYSKTYTFLISRIPWLWGVMFRLLDIPWLLFLVRGARRLVNTVNGSRLKRFLIEAQFDDIFSTHFFPNEVSAYLKRTGQIQSNVACIVTDYDVHSIWLSPGVDHYAVASEWTKKKIMLLGVPEERILVSGIPTSSQFSTHKDIPALKQQLGLKEDVFTVLVATGSFGIGPIEEIIENLPGFQVVVVCGHNQVLYQRLSREKKELVKICGLVNNMHELMAVSDVMITKPGGLSISEALVTGLPLIFFNAIPGQESNNIKVLQEHGIGISGYQVREMAQVLNRYRSSSDEFHSAKEATKNLARPAAAQTIADLVK